MASSRNAFLDTSKPLSSATPAPLTVSSGCDGSISDGDRRPSGGGGVVGVGGDGDGEAHLAQVLTAHVVLMLLVVI